MKILIYDDDENDTKQLSICIENYFSQIKINYSLKICSSTDELFSTIKDYDILFLDIQLNNENGIDIGLRLKKIYHECRIIIVSNYSKYAIEGYKIHADRYFLKPISQEIFNIEMENIIQSYLRKYLGFYDEKISNKKIYYHNILYIEVIGRKTYIHTLTTETYTSSYTLKYWYQKLHKYGFEHSHQSFIINLEHISAFGKNEVYLISDDAIPLSRNCKYTLEIEFTKYLQGVF